MNVLAATVLVCFVLQRGTPPPDAQRDPKSPPKSTCIDCHARLAGALGKSVSEWRTSIHGRKGITCVDCHGGDRTSERYAKSPAAGYKGIPRMRDVPYACGRCHQPIKEKHLGSPHGAHGLPHCVSCHGYHAIERPDPKRIITEEACTKCHDFAAPKRALAALEKADELQAAMARKLKEIEHLPYAKAEFLRQRTELKLERSDVVAAFHSFQIGEIQRIGTNAERLLKAIALLEERETQRRRQKNREIPFILTLMGFLVLGTALGYVVFHRSPPIGTT